jgi:putative peptidoglycan lipid II flippase
MGETQKAVTRRAGIVGLGTLASRILGLVRESVIAAYFPKEVIDAFMVAFMLPNMFRRLTAEGAFSISVVSVFSKIWSKGDLDASRQFTRAVFGFSLLFLLALTVVGVFGAKWLTLVAGSGFTEHPEKFALAVSLTRFMFPYILFISLTSIAMGLLNSTGRFFAPAFAPVLLNVAIIGCAVGLAGTMPGLGLNPIFALGIGVLVGGVAQVVFQIPSLKKTGLLVKPSLQLKHKGLRQVLRLTGPMIFGAAAYQLQIIISFNFASNLGHGAVTYIQFANRLLELPLAVLVMAISTAALPSLSMLKGQNRTEEMKRTYNHALRLALFVATPAMVGLIVLSEPVIAVLYQRGLFSHQDALQTASGLRWLAAGACSIALVRQTVPVFYAMEQTVVPVVMSVVSIIVFVASSLYLREPFGHTGICMALSLAATAQGIGLVLVLRKRLGRLGIGRTAVSFLRTLFVSLLMAPVAYHVSTFGAWEKGGNSVVNITFLFLAVIAGVAVFALGAYVLGAPELGELFQAAQKRRSKRTV